MRERGAAYGEDGSTWTRSAVTASGSGYRRSWTRTRRCGPPVGSHRENLGQRTSPERTGGLRRCLLHRRYRRSRRRAGAALQAGPWAASGSFRTSSRMSWRTGGPIWPCRLRPNRGRPPPAAAAGRGRRQPCLLSHGGVLSGDGLLLSAPLAGGTGGELAVAEVADPGITPRPAAVCAMHRRQRPRRTCVCGNIWEELSAAEDRHARQLLSLLEQMVLG